MTLSGHRTSGSHSLLGFTDVHCHCLPGLDDGPEDMAEALKLCQALANDRITHVVATPHQLGRFDGRCEPQTVRRAVAQLRQALGESGIALAVRPGADVRLDERMPQLLQADRVLTVADAGRYLLLELPREVFIDPHVLLDQLAQMNVIAVITHPERDAFLSQDPTYVNRWSRHGACLQLTAGSFLGDFGPQSEQAAWTMLDAQMPIVVATDAHNVDSRPPRMTAAFRRLSERRGRAAALTLCVQNPRRLAVGRPLCRLGERPQEVAI